MNRQLVTTALLAAAIGLCGGALGAFAWLGASPGSELESTCDSGSMKASSSGTEQPREITPETARTINLALHEVDFGALEEVIELLGSVEAVPDLSHVVSPRTAGQVLHMHVQVGDEVRRGDVLLEMDSAELARNIFEARRLETEYQELLVQLTRSQGRVRQLEVERQTSEEAAVLAEAEVGRLGAAEQVVALNELSASKAAALQARASAKQKAVALQVARDEALAVAEQTKALRLSREALLAVSNVDPNQADVLLDAEGQDTCEEVDRTLSLIRLRSPIDGVVVERNVAPGQGVEAGQALLVVADYSRVQVHGELPESLLGRVSRGGPVEARIRPQSDPDKVVEGRVRFISPVIDPVKRTAHLLVETPNPEGLLRDGAFVNVAVVVRSMTDEQDWPVVVPASAVLEDGPAYYVFKQVQPDALSFERTEITPGIRNDIKTLYCLLCQFSH